MGNTIQTGDLADESVTSAKVKDGEIVNADVAAAAAIAYSKLATDPRIARVKAGTYTGDGTTSQAITGIGFEPKMVLIFEHHTSAATWDRANVKITDMASNIAFQWHQHAYKTDEIVSLDSDGFTVDDKGANEAPNENNVVYDYVAIG